MSGAFCPLAIIILNNPIQKRHWFGFTSIHHTIGEWVPRAPFQPMSYLIKIQFSDVISAEYRWFYVAWIPGLQYNANRYICDAAVITLCHANFETVTFVYLPSTSYTNFTPIPTVLFLKRVSTLTPSSRQWRCETCHPYRSLHLIVLSLHHRCASRALSYIASGNLPVSRFLCM